MNILFLLKEMQSWRQFFKEVLFVLGSISLLTVIILFFQLSVRIPDSLLLYLVVILIFACVCGLRAALLASFIAFMILDYLFVPPVNSFVVTKLQDVFGLVVFLITAMVISHLTSLLRLYTLHARQREYEARTLYEFMRATNREINMEQQLTVFLKAMVDLFASEGLRDCMLILSETSDTLISQNIYLHVLQDVPLLFSEEVAIDWLMTHGRSIDLYDYISLPPMLAARLATQTKQRKRRKAPENYIIRLIPLKTETKVYGVLRLLIEEAKDYAKARNPLGIKDPFQSTRDMFFPTFLEQAISIIEQERLRETNIHLEVLQKTETLRSALFSSVSHDLRTPLAIIKAAASNLLQDGILQEHDGSMNSVLSIEQEVDRLDELVENVLDMSRIEAGSLRLEKIWYPLKELVSDTVSHMQALLGKREVHMIYPDELPPVKIDVVQIEQVLFNLLENALCYTPEGSPIDICVQRQPMSLLVSVEDRGCGIPPSERMHIFQKFYRLPQHNGAPDHPRGLGLGLAICQGIIRAHDGQIWIEDREGGGSIFSFTLPLDSITEDDIDE